MDWVFNPILCTWYSSLGPWQLDTHEIDSDAIGPYPTVDSRSPIAHPKARSSPDLRGRIHWQLFPPLTAVQRCSIPCSTICRAQTIKKKSNQEECPGKQSHPVTILIHHWREGFVRLFSPLALNRGHALLRWEFSAAAFLIRLVCDFIGNTGSVWVYKTVRSGVIPSCLRELILSSQADMSKPIF